MFQILNLSKLEEAGERFLVMLRGTQCPRWPGTGVRRSRDWGHHLSPSELNLAANTAALVGNRKPSADSKLPSPSEYRCVLLEKESLRHLISILAFWC